MDSIIKQIYENSVRLPGKTALTGQGQSVTYQELWNRAEAFAGELKKTARIRKGSRILLEEGEDLIGSVVAYLGIQLAEAVAVPVEYRISESSLEYVVERVKPLLVLSRDKITELLQASRESVGKSTKKRTFPGADQDSDIIFTTGTTGQPECILHTFGSMKATVENLIDLADMEEGDKYLLTAPFNLAFGLRRLLTSLYLGATAVLMKSLFPLNEFYGAILQHRITYLVLIPSQLSVLLRGDREKLDVCIRQMRAVQVGSNAMVERDREEFLKRYPDTSLYYIYGSTETGCILGYDCHSRQKGTGCLGIPAKNAAVFLIDEKGEKVESPETYGFIAARGAMNMKGYYRKKALTEAMLRDGMALSRDIGYFDGEGYFYFVSRVGDVINVGTHKVIPQEIENAALEIPGVRECVCTAQKDARFGQVPKLVVVLDNEYSCSIQDILIHLSEKLESYKVPQSIEVAEEIPKTIQGKVLRRRLR